MNISSYNITDVSYHYIGLRVLAGLPAITRREEQLSVISRSVQKYVSDKALQLMLPEPRGTFETVGEKICQELVHFQFARSARGAYELTEMGKYALGLLDDRKHVELRRLMVQVHIQTYDNLRAVVQRYLEVGEIWLPIVEASQLGVKGYIQQLLEPTFNGEAALVATDVLEKVETKSPKKLEDALRERVLRQTLPDVTISVSLFRALSDRLVSLRLLNIMKASTQGGEFAKSYSPCVLTSPPHDWYIFLNIPLSSGGTFSFYFCEPNMLEKTTQQNLLWTIDEALSVLSPQAGYYDLPEMRDFVCERLRIPESAFDEGVNYLLDLQTPPITVGLRYEGISGRRKPLTRDRETIQIYNLIRRT